jgi:hypothetical protein
MGNVKVMWVMSFIILGWKNTCSWWHVPIPLLWGLLSTMVKPCLIKNPTTMTTLDFIYTYFGGPHCYDRFSFCTFGVKIILVLGFTIHMVSNELTWPIWTLQTQVMAKKRVRSQIAKFDSRTLKVGNHPDFLVYRWREIYRWKAFDKGYNFASDLISIKGLHTKLWPLKGARVPTLGISGLPLGSPRTKWHLSVGPVARHGVYYKGEGGGFPQVQAVVNLVSPCLPVARQCTKGIQTMH